MSGGHFDYLQHRMTEAALLVDDVLRCGQGDYSPEVLRRFTETAHELRRTAEMLGHVDYLVCGDTGDASFLHDWETGVRPPFVIEVPA